MHNSPIRLKKADRTSTGKSFQGLTRARQNGLTVAFETQIADTRACMPEVRESDYVIHPTTLDSMLQAMLIAIPRMDNIEKQVWVPTGAASIRISSDKSRTYGTALHGVVEASHTGVREMTGSFLVNNAKQLEDS